MSLEPILVFFLIRHLRKNLRTFSPDAMWDKVFTYSMYGVILLVILQLTLSLAFVTMWVWHLLLLAIVYISFRLPIFIRVRTVMIAVLPLIAVSLFSDILETQKYNLYKYLETFLEIAFAIAVTWMVAMLIKSNKQNKALEQERRRTHEEEEKTKFIEAQKVELELIVIERTAEITHQKDELQNALIELKATQTQLIHSEKMASLGELTAGIAHEIQNPLNFVNNFSEINFELIEEMKNELVAGNAKAAVSIAENIKDNEQKIIHHGKRADSIVKGMLQHSRSSNGQKELTDINALADEYLRLSYHGLRAKDKSFNATMETDFDKNLEKINVIPQDVGRAFLNLFTNAFYAVTEKKKLEMDGYKPTVAVYTKQLGNRVEIKVRDNGVGISKKALDKIFQPFFTTKPSGQGTGLGLSLSYDIITQGHGGEVKVETKEGEFTEFVV
ncbi:MAG: ATP-binding protein, partial [Ginsengibacter sp.]